MKAIPAATLAFAISSVNAFVPVGTHQRQTLKFHAASLSEDFVENESSSDAEIDRRLALVKAAAMASGIVLMSPTSASAKSAIFSLEAKVTDIEKKNLATMNTNGDPTKHTPVVTIEDSTSMVGKVVKFTVPHVMDAEKPHYIEYMWLEDVSGKQKKPPGNIVAVKAFKKTDAAPPTLVENVASGRLPTLKAGIVKGMILKPCLYCNLHGLWEGEPMPIV
jgi:desulfoferrodoxin (superoxide reductase-like protein)